jgi:hypothetical protein
MQVSGMMGDRRSRCYFMPHHGDHACRDRAAVHPRATPEAALAIGWGLNDPLFVGDSMVSSILRHGPLRYSNLAHLMIDI